VRTVPAVPLRTDLLAETAQPVRAQPGTTLSLTVGAGRKGGVEATLVLGLSGDAEAAWVEVASDAPLTVSCGSTSSPAPARVELGRGGAARVLVLEDPATGARVTVLVAPPGAR
jgi:hypothetical protein